MNYESVEQALEQLHKLGRMQAAYHHALGLLDLDGATAAPSDSWEGRGVTMGVLSEAVYQLIAKPENGALIAYLKEHEAVLDEMEKRELELIAKSYAQLYRIPQEEYVAYNILLNDAQAIWEKAKSADDFSLFQPYLEQIVAYNKKFAGYYDPELAPYDALLNEYEEGMTMEVLDAFFAQLRSAIVPLLDQIRNQQNNEHPFLHRNYPAERQREFSEYLMDVMGLDRACCSISESEHPFTTNFNNRDVHPLSPGEYAAIHVLCHP